MSEFDDRMSLLQSNLISIFEEFAKDPPDPGDEQDLTDLMQALCMSIGAWIRHPEKFPELESDFIREFTIMAVIAPYVKSCYGMGVKRGKVNA
jgi:hypothetical protein